MSDFGDFEDSDAVDTEPADPEQVARKLHRLRRKEGFEVINWDDLSPGDRGTLIQIVAVMLAWLRRSGAT